MSQYTEIGFLARAHGIRGDLRLRLHGSYAGMLENLHALFLHRGGAFIPYFLESARLVSEGEAIVHFEGVNDRNLAEALRGQAVFAPAEIADVPEVPASDPTEFIGYRVSDVNHGFIGMVTDVYTLPQQELLAIRQGSREILIPLRLELIREWLPDQKTLLFDLPEGILEL